MVNLQKQLSPYKDFESIVPPKPNYSLDWKYRYPKMTAEQREHHIKKVTEWQKNNREKHREYMRIAYWRLKKEAFEMLGGKCKKCGFSDVRALSVNHKFGQEKGNKLTGRKLWRRIVDGKININELSLLCMNCNHIYEYERGKYKIPKRRR